MRRPSPTPSCCSSWSSEPVSGSFSSTPLFLAPCTRFLTFFSGFICGAASLSFMSQSSSGDDLADLLGLLPGRADLAGQLTELLARLAHLLARLAHLLGQAVDAAAR